MTIPVPGDRSGQNSPRAEVYVLRSGDGACLYVGQTTQLQARLRKHARTQPWWPEVASLEVHQVALGTPPKRLPALLREAELMAELQPRYSRPTAEIARMAARP